MRKSSRTLGINNIEQLQFLTTHVIIFSKILIHEPQCLISRKSFIIFCSVLVIKYTKSYVELY